MPLSYSPHESEVLNLKIARGNQRFDALPLEAIRQQVFENHYDICKIKVNSSNKALFMELDELGFPYQILSVVYRNVRSITAEDGDYQLPEGIEYEAYDGSQKEIYKSLVTSSIGNPTGISYSIWPLSMMISPEADLEMSVAYSLGFAQGSGDPKKQAWLLKDQGEYVGMFMGIVDAGTFEGTLYGVAAKSRKKGYGKLIYAIMKKICFEKGLNYFYTDVQIQNTASQKSTLHGGLNPESIFFHVFLTPFASHHSSDIYTRPVEGLGWQEIHSLVHEIHAGNMPSGMGPGRISSSMSDKNSESSSHSLKSWKVYSDSRNSLWTTQLADSEENVVGLISSHYSTNDQ